MKQVIKPALVEANCAQETAALRIYLMETAKKDVETVRCVRI